MNLRRRVLPPSVLAGMTLLLGMPAQASLAFDVYPGSVHQIGTTSSVKLGHTVWASTNINRLIAGGSFRTSCDRQELGEISGERVLTSALIGQQNVLFVTVPETLPAIRTMPGFLNLPRGQRSRCGYHWRGFAEEGTMTVGIPGSSTTLGGERASDTGTVDFWMTKPGTATGEDDACLP